jgi:hypothetical protein
VLGVVGEGHPHVLRLGAVDEVAEDPADARGALVVQTIGGQLLLTVEHEPREVMQEMIAGP